MLLERPYPAATSCVLVGRVPPDLGERLKPYTRVAWIVDPEGANFPPREIRAGALEIVSLATLTAVGFETWLDRFVGRTPRHLPSLFVSEAVKTHDAERYDEIIAILHRSLEAHHRARVTRQKDGFIWQRQLLENVSAYAERRLPAAWRGTLSGVPAFVCGAGPSLDVSGPHLARVAERGIIFAADSALRTLAKLGVKADFVVSIDAAKTPEKCLPQGFIPARVVLSAISPVAWQTAVPRESQTFISSNQLTLDWLATQGVVRTEIAVDENCGATALTLARYLGCAPIHLFGLDLALDANQPGRRNTAAADATLYAQSGFDAAQDFPQVPGNFSATVPTHVLGDWNALDARLAAWPAGLVRNVTDRGARLRNTTVIRPSELVVDSSSEAKAAALARLPIQKTEAVPPGAAGFLELRRVGQLALAALPDLRRTLDTEGSTALVGALRPLFSNPTFGRGLGAFSLKVMPHLVPPVEGEVAFWKTLLDELQILAELARDASSAI